MSARPFVLAGVLLAAMAAGASAQELAVRGFADVGSTRFTAERSFETILGDARGTVPGGGGEVVVGPGIFVNLRASRFERTGQRVFLFGDEVFPLDLETTVRVRPIELTAGYRVRHGRWRVTPYGGAGVGWHRYEETTPFADADENVSDTYRGFHVLGGAEWRLLRWLGAAGEVQWTTVPDALGQDPNGVSAAFDETDLGGITVRVKVVVGTW